MPQLRIPRPSNFRLGLYFEVPHRMKDVKPKLFAGRNYTIIHHTDTDVYLYTNNWMDGRLGDRATKIDQHQIREELLDRNLSSLGMSRFANATLRDYTRTAGIWTHRVSWKELLTFCPVADTEYKSGLSKFFSKHGYMETKEPEFRLLERDTGVPY